MGWGVWLTSQLLISIQSQGWRCGDGQCSSQHLLNAAFMFMPACECYSCMCMYLKNRL